eukprot:gene8705-28422_t
MSCRPSPATALKATIVGNAETAAELVAFLTSEGVAGVGVEGDARDGGDTTLINNENNAALGLVIGWLMVNRRHDTQCTLTLEACPSQPFNMFPCPAAEAVGAAAAAAAVTASLPSPSPRLGHYNYNGGAHPGKTVEVYHLHCHFNEEEGSEEAARALLSSTTQAVKDAGGTPLHDFICAAATALGAAAQHLMQWTRPPDADTKGLYLAVHADTDQEWSDHTLRLGWFGPQDPAPLDVAFFPTPPDGYEGVKAHLRKSSAEAVYSMGEEWPRGADGAVLKTAYGAMDRK